MENQTINNNTEDKKVEKIDLKQFEKFKKNKPNREQSKIPNFGLINKSFHTLKKIVESEQFTAEDLEKESVNTRPEQNFHKIVKFVEKKIEKIWKDGVGTPESEETKERKFIKHLMIAFAGRNCSTIPTEKTPEKPWSCALTNLYLMSCEDIDTISITFIDEIPLSGDIPSDIFKFCRVYENKLNPTFSNFSDRVLTYPAYLALMNFVTGNHTDPEIAKIIRRVTETSYPTTETSYPTRRVTETSYPTTETSYPTTRVKPVTDNKKRPELVMSSLDDKNLSVLAKLKESMPQEEIPVSMGDETTQFEEN